MEKSKRWAPVLKEDGTYCSPGCGRGCTKKEYDRACKDADNLVKLIKKGISGAWRAKVWENLGWHYSVQCGLLSLHCSNYPTGKYYTVLTSLNPKHVGCGDSRLEVISGKNPVKLIRKATKNLRLYLLEVETVIAFHEREFSKKG